MRVGGAGYDRHMPDVKAREQWIRSIKSVRAEPMMQVLKTRTPEESAALANFFIADSELKIKFNV